MDVQLRLSAAGLGIRQDMTIGTSIFLIATGAILRFAVSDRIEGVDLSTVGLILLILGVVGLIIGLWQTRRFTAGRDPEPAAPERERVVRERY